MDLRKINRKWLQRTDITLGDVSGEFAAPGSEYKPYAFWFWGNGTTLEEVTSQARGMAEKGLNPGYLQGRGFEDYFGDHWFECVEETVKATKRSGAGVGFCDEIGAPCGIFCGRLLYYFPEYTACSLDFRKIILKNGETEELPECFFAVKCRYDAEKQQIDSDTLAFAEKSVTAVGSDVIVYLFDRYLDKSGSGSEVNYLDASLPDKLIELIHRPYQYHIGGDFGKTVSGCFMDVEGDYGYKLAYSADLEKKFAELTGRNMRLQLPLLLDEDIQGKFIRTRCDWTKAVSEVYINGFFGKINDFYAENGMYVTAHTWEEKLYAQVMLVGDFMKYCRAISMPGVDALFLSDRNVRTYAETASVCELEGRRMMSEQLGVSGFEITTTDIKKTLNDSFSFGVTHTVLHGVYSVRKPGEVIFQPDFYNWNPYFRYFDQISDFIGRVSLVMSSGRLNASVLLFCPILTVTGLLGDSVFDRNNPYHCYILDSNGLDIGRHGEEILSLENSYTDAMNHLADNNIDFIVADEYYLDRFGGSEGGILTYRDFSFDTLILPPVRIMSKNILKKIRDFAANGGRVLALGSLPDSSPEYGLNDPEVIALSADLRECASFSEVTDISSACEKDLLQPKIRFISGGERLLTRCRTIDGRHFYWIANNTGEDREITAVFCGENGSPVIWNCENGRKYAAKGIPSENGVEVRLRLRDSEAIFIVFGDDGPADIPVERSRSIVIDGTWTVSVNPEAQPAEYRKDEVRDHVPEKYTAYRHSPNHPDGFETELDTLDALGLGGFSGFIDYKKTVMLSEVNENMLLRLEDMRNTAQVWVNGKNCGARLWAGYEFEIGKYLHPGENELRIRIGTTVNPVTKDGKQTTPGLVGKIEILY